MGRTILGEYGPDTPKYLAPSASCGGISEFRDVNNYQPPIGPTTFSHEGPGLANHTNHGNKGSQHG